SVSSTLSLHDSLPIFGIGGDDVSRLRTLDFGEDHFAARRRDRARADAGCDNGRSAGTAAREIFGQIHDFAEPMIHHGELPVDARSEEHTSELQSRGQL